MLIYFFFNLLGGERGLISYFKKKVILTNLKIEQNKLANSIDILELKNSLVQENLHLDYIETLIREKFLFGKKHETTYIIKNNEN